MQENRAQDVVDRTRAYYDSGDADAFYESIWGGEDIHVGIYQGDGDDIRLASQRTVEKMARVAGRIDARTRVLDIGAGYGGSARWIAKRFGCRVCCSNLSERQNRRNEQLTAEQGLTSLIEVHTGNFEQLPFDDGTFDLVWSQDAILHSGRRAQVLGEAYRVLAAGGAFVFTDPMQSDDCPAGALAPVLQRIHLSSLASPGYYLRTAREVGFTELDFNDLSAQLISHYSHVARSLRERGAGLACSQDYIAGMLEGLKHWVDSGQSGYLRWGIFRFAKPTHDEAA